MVFIIYLRCTQSAGVICLYLYLGLLWKVWYFLLNPTCKHVSLSEVIIISVLTYKIVSDVKHVVNINLRTM